MTCIELRRTWGENIRATRRKRGLSIRALADRADLTEPHLSRVEAGLVGLGDERRIRVAHVLGVRVESLFTYPPPPEHERRDEL